MNNQSITDNLKESVALLKYDFKHELSLFEIDEEIQEISSEGSSSYLASDRSNKSMIKKLVGEDHDDFPITDRPQSGPRTHLSFHVAQFRDMNISITGIKKNLKF